MTRPVYTRRNYEQIAAVIAPHHAYSGMRDVATALAAIFAADNPRFDRARFMQACGFPEVNT